MVHSSTELFLISKFATSAGLAGAMQTCVPSSQEGLSELHTQPQIPSLVQRPSFGQALLAMEHVIVVREPFSKRPTHSFIDVKQMTSKGRGTEMVLEDSQSQL